MCFEFIFTFASCFSPFQLPHETRLIFTPSFRALRHALNSVAFNPNAFTFYLVSRLETGAHLWTCESHSRSDKFLVMDFELPPTPSNTELADRVRENQARIYQLENEKFALKSGGVSSFVFIGFCIA